MDSTAVSACEPSSFCADSSFFTKIQATPFTFFKLYLSQIEQLDVTSRCFVVVKPLRLASLPTFIASQLLESKKRQKLSCTPFMQDSEASSQRAASSGGDDCEGADDETSEEEEEETISNREMLDIRL
jgi:hypothetical protein